MLVAQLEFIFSTNLYLGLNTPPMTRYHEYKTTSLFLTALILHFRSIILLLLSPTRTFTGLCANISSLPSVPL